MRDLFVLCAFVGHTGALLAASSATAPAADDLFATRIRPLLTERCTSCHGVSRHKGGLSLHTPEAISKGGEDGKVLIPGKPGESDLMRRLRLPVDDDDHMPPKSKPQLSEEEIKVIEAWIASGATFGSATSAPAAQSPAAQSVTKAKSVETDASIPPPSPAAVRALRESLVHVEGVTQGSHALRLNFAAVAKKITEADVLRLVRPVLPQLESLLLARCPVGDETAKMLAAAPRLRELDLRGSRVTDAGVAALSHLPSLQELVLAQTSLTDASASHLLAFAALQNVYLWKAGISAEAIARVRKERPKLQIDAGDFRPATTQEAEAKIKLTSDAPPLDGAKPATAASKPAVVVPTQPAAVAVPPQSQPAAATLKAVNALCPVTGQPVVAAYSIVYRDRVIGFCCPKCPGKFWAHPGKFESKLGLPQ